MISLDGAVTLSQMDHISEAVCKDLKLNMSRIYHEMFNIHGTVAKSDLRLFSGGCIGFRKFLRCRMVEKTAANRKPPRVTRITAAAIAGLSLKYAEALPAMDKSDSATP